YQEDRELLVVEPGGRWGATLPARAQPDAAPVAPPPGALASGGAERACGELDGDVPASLRCYEQQASGAGLPAQIALYELARLRRDSLGDLPGALASLRELRGRFPGGALRMDADLSIAELLPRLGRFDEA